MNELNLPDSGPVLCAVSGGADSMCLLHLLHSRGIEVIAAHYEHGIRGEESRRDACFVEDWCRERGIRCLVEHGDVPAWAAERGLGLEEAARELRYEFLERSAGAMGCEYIATAHNADDNVETIIFNLARGSGTLGLRGIPPRRGRLIRPLLSWSRAEIESYLEENGLPHVEDSSNGSDDYSRNLIRHRVSPVLREINPAVDRAVARTARLLREDEECLSALAEDFIARHYDGESLPALELAAQPAAVAGRVIRRLCPKGLELEHVDAAMKLLEGSGLKYLDLPGLRLRREQGRLYFREYEKLSLPERRLIPGCWVQVPELGLELLADFTGKNGEINGLFKTYRLKCENIDSGIFCGGRKNGDSLRPLGRGCTKSLKSLFGEAGYTQAERDRALVLRDEKGIMAVLGLCIAERCAAGAEEPAVTIKIREI